MNEITIIMPHRLEKPETMLNTTASVFEACSFASLVPEIINEEDKNGIGCGPMRHKGIVQAHNDCILLIDPHMSFALDSIGMMYEFWKAHKTDIVCSASYANDTDSLILDDSSKLVGFGANIQKFSPQTTRIFERVWLRDPAEALGAALEPGRPLLVPCVLGACYMLSKSRYLAKLGGFAQFLVSTGWFEQALSILQTLTGGNCWCLPEAKTLHQYRSVSSSPYPSIARWQKTNNQLFMLYSFVPPYLYSDYEKCLQLPENRTEDYGIKYLLKSGAFTKMAETLSKYQTNSFEEVSQSWL